MSVTYSAAPQVANIASKLIPEHHDHLADVTVEFVFRSEHAERHGNVVLGKARKVSGLNAFLVHAATGEGGDEPFFVIEVAQDIWSVFTSDERVALVDHELSHCRIKVTKDGTQLYVAPPDIEDFAGVINRHGLWRPDLREFFKTVKTGQPTLWSQLDELEDGDASVTDIMAAAQ